MHLTQALRCEIGQVLPIEIEESWILDPRPNYPRHWRFVINYTRDYVRLFDGSFVVYKYALLGRIRDDLSLYDDPEEEHDIDDDDGPFRMRVYDWKIEDIPRFDTTTYRYQGLERERVPLETTLLIVDPSVTVILQSAFADCRRIMRCFMYDGVHTIEQYAFADCWTMRVVRLSQNLRVIEEGAFQECGSLDALFLPPRVEIIGDDAFYQCSNIQIVTIPPRISVIQIGATIFRACDTFFRVTRIEAYRDHDDEVEDRGVLNNVLDFYENGLNPLYRTCLATNVNANAISGCIQQHARFFKQVLTLTVDNDGMAPTALHILAMNPHAHIEEFTACYAQNIQAIFEIDDRERTPLYYMDAHSRLEFFQNLHPLHIICLDVNITADEIHERIEEYDTDVSYLTDPHGITPLHILAANPHDNSDVITAYCEDRIGAVFVRDNMGSNPLDYLERYGKFEAMRDLLVSLVTRHNDHAV